MIIYKATCKVNGKKYIGLTRQEFEVRVSKHISNAINGSEFVFHKAIRKYGCENFEFEIIDTADSLEELREKEKYWINQLRTYIGFNDCNGYNSTLGGEGRGEGYEFSDESRLKMARSQGAKPFLVFDSKGVFIGRYESQAQCSRDLSIKNIHLSKTLKGVHKSVGGHIAIYEHEYTSELLEEKIVNLGLTEEKVAEIKKLLMDGKISQRKMAKMYDVNPATISEIATGRKWSSVVVEGWSPTNNSRVKLTEDDVVAIKNLLIRGMTYKQIAKEFNVFWTTISRIKSEQCWKDVKVEGWDEWMAS